MPVERREPPRTPRLLLATPPSWSRPLAESALSIAFAALFLSAAGTVEAGFTLQVSYVAAAAGVVAGAPFVLRGWSTLPRSVQLAAAALAGTYVLVALLGHPQALAGASRSSHRALVYVLDLGLGLATIGLVVGLADTPRRLRRLVVVLAAGIVAGALIGIYQWAALHWGWPLSDINTAPNSDGFSTGHRYQGAGLFGWERARGTFKEPLYFAVFAATGLPIVAGLALAPGRLRRWWALGATVVTFALILTVSSLAWGVLLLCAVMAGCLLTIARGQVRLARATGALVAVAVLIGPLVFVDPGVLAAATGRSAGALRLTASNRTSAWDRAITAWEQRPLVGQGPGQSSVRLAYRPDASALGAGRKAPVVLGSAQGLWAASLVDGGLLAITAWIALLGGLLVVVARAGLRTASPAVVTMLAAAMVAVLAAQLAGDRLEVRVWLVLGLAAAASRVLGSQARKAGEQPAESPEQRR